MQVGNLREPVDTMKIEVYTVTCGNVQFRGQWKVVELEGMYLIP